MPPPETPTITTRPATKPGITTTEFWVHLGVQAVTVYQLVAHTLPPTVAAWVMTALVVTYTASRTLTKIFDALTRMLESLGFSTDAGGNTVAPTTLGSPSTGGTITGALLLVIALLVPSFLSGCMDPVAPPGQTLTAQDVAIQRVVRIQQVYLPLKAVLVSGVNSGEIKGNTAKATQAAIAVFDAELNAATEAAKAGTSTTAQLDALQRSLDNFQFNNPPPTPTTQPAK